MAETLDPQQQVAYDAYERRKREYEEELANAPVEQKPGFWRQLAAGAVGAVGGWNFDRGGMQWGPALAREITEGPYQRRMNEHLKRLAARRQGLDVAQEGMQVMNQAENWKQLAAQRKQDGENRKALKEQELKAERQKQVQVYDHLMAKNSGGEALRYESMEHLKGDADAQAKIKAGTHVVHNPPGTDLVYIMPTNETRRRAAFDNVKPIVTSINEVIKANPSLAKRGFRELDMETASAKGESWLQNYFREMNDVLNLEMQIRNRATGGGGGKEDPDIRQRRYEHNQIWANSRRNVATIQSQIASLQNRIATTQDETIKAALRENLKDLQQNIAETLNAAYQEDPMMKPESMKQYEVVDGVLREKGTATQSAPAQSQGAKKLTDELAEKFLREAGMDEVKAAAAARAQGYTWE